MDVYAVNSCSFLFHKNVYDQSIRKSWDALLVYVSSEDPVKIAQFDFILNYKAFLSDECIVMGDFNSTLYHSKKQEGILLQMLI